MSSHLRVSLKTAWTVVLVVILMAANMAVTAVERRLLVWRE